MGFDRKCIVCLLFLYTIAPASLKLTIYTSLNEEDNVEDFGRFKRENKDTTQASKYVRNRPEKNGILNLIFSDTVTSMGMLGSVRSLIPIGGNNLLNMRRKRSLNDYTSNKKYKRVYKRSISDFDGNATNNNADAANLAVESIQTDNVNVEATAGSNETSSDSNVASNSSIRTDTGTDFSQNNDMNIVTENSSGIVAENLSTLTLNYTTGTYNETATDVNQNNVNIVSVTGLVLISDNSSQNFINGTDQDLSNDEFNQTSFKIDSRRAFNVQNNDNETLTQVTLLSSEFRQDNASHTILNDFKSSQDNLSNFLNVTVKEYESNVTDNGQSNNLNYSLNVVSGSAVENDNNSKNVNNNTSQNLSTDLKDSIYKLVLDKIPNIVSNAVNMANKTNEIFIIKSPANEKTNRDGNTDGVDTAKIVNDRDNLKSDDKPDNVYLNLNGDSGSQITYIHNLLVNFFFA